MTSAHDRSDGVMTAQKQAGRCGEHHDLAWMYDDGSVMCMGALILETSTSSCTWQSMPPTWAGLQPVAFISAGGRVHNACSKVGTNHGHCRPIYDITLPPPFPHTQELPRVVR